MHIFIHHNDEQLGPFSEDEVRARIAAGEFSAEDHVWWEGQGDWMPLSDSSLFAPIFEPVSEQAAPPETMEEIEPKPEPELKPMPEPEAKPAPQKRSQTRASSSRPKAQSSMGLVIGGIVIGVAILGGLGYYLFGTDSQDFNSILNQPPQPYQVAPPPSAPSTPAPPPAPEASPAPSASPAPEATQSPMPTPIATSPQLSPAPQPLPAPAADPATNAAPPLSPNPSPNP